LAYTIRSLCPVYLEKTGGIIQRLLGQVDIDVTFGTIPILPAKIVLATALNRNWSVKITCDQLVRKGAERRQDSYNLGAFDSLDDAMSLQNF